MRKTKKAVVSDPERTTPTAPAATGPSFPIIGIGASAGGLEAFELFFKTMPAGSGMAFVLVSHLDPGHASMLSEILQRITTMPVHEAEDQMQIQPNHVYIIPPAKDMAIFHSALHLSVPEQARGLRLPIDSFFRSLAEDQGERAICVILSGTGSDGTLGLRAIHGAGGVSFVQEPTTAKYDGMPSSAVQSGLATYVMPVEKEKIFERGYGKNTGLGLFLSRDILDITGITIKETGKPGKGARFEMTVPKEMWRIERKGT
jgi:two-component system CheB/CheR fusion protein